MIDPIDSLEIKFKGGAAIFVILIMIHSFLSFILQICVIWKGKI